MTDQWWFRWSLVGTYLIAAFALWDSSSRWKVSTVLLHFCQGFLEKCLDPTAIFTFVLAIATIWLVVATLQLSKSAEKSSERQLRAYLSVPKRQLKVNPAGDEVTVSLVVHNFGQTPANAIHIGWNIAIDDYPVPLSLTSSSPEDGEGFLAPSDEFTTYDIVHIPSSELKGINNDTRALWVTGIILYQDAFGIDRRTEFRFYATGSEIYSADAKMCIDNTGNYAT